MKLDPVTGQPPLSNPRNHTTDLLQGIQDELPMLPIPTPRTKERLAASTGTLTQAPVIFIPAAKIPYAGLLLALPSLEATGLLSCAQQVYSLLKPGFCSLTTIILEAVLRTLAGEPRAEFDRESRFPALFAYLYAQGFDVLIWRKSSILVLENQLFSKATVTDQWGQPH